MTSLVEPVTKTVWTMSPTRTLSEQAQSCDKPRSADLQEGMSADGQPFTTTVSDGREADLEAREAALKAQLARQQAANRGENSTVEMPAAQITVDKGLSRNAKIGLALMGAAALLAIASVKGWVRW